MRTNANTPERRLSHILTGPAVPRDPRITAVRGNLADIGLTGEIFSPYYAEPLPRGCIAARVMVHAGPDAASEAISEIIHGEHFAVLDLVGEWAWGYCGHDGYCGFVPHAALGVVVQATHAVDTPAALIHAEPDFKAPALARLPMGARVHAEGAAENGEYLHIGEGFIHNRFIRPVGTGGDDPVALAERLIGAPYLWGGRSGDGLDCSGLVQLVLGLTGTAAPRDSDQQQAALGRELAEGETLRRGDLVFFPDHVGLMADDATIVHANAHWMRTVAEPLADVVARFVARGGPDILAMRRLG